MTRLEAVNEIIGGVRKPQKSSGFGAAASNIALCKYWGKRQVELNLPVNSSLSLSLSEMGTTSMIRPAEQEMYRLNEKEVHAETQFAVRLRAFLDLFRSPGLHFRVDTTNTVPTAAGLASSASGYAATVLALNDLFGWDLPPRQLSILARLGSGSASRSIFSGFVQWHRGKRDDGMDSFAEPLSEEWPDLKMAVLPVSVDAKPVGSTEGMKQTIASSVLYSAWPKKAARDLALIRDAIHTRQFELLGRTAESNALAMHATMIDTWPPVLYWLPESITGFQQIWELRQEGVPIYFTMDAGPNIKLLFEKEHLGDIRQVFPSIQVVR